MIEYNTKIQKILEQQLRKIFVGKTDLKKSRPVLNNIHYIDNKIEMTNSHVALRLKVDKLDDIKKVELSNYPNLDPIFKLPIDILSHTFKMEEMKLLEDHLNVIYKQKIETVLVTFNNEGITIIEPKTSLDNHFISSNINYHYDTDFTLCLNPRYLHDCLMFFRKLKANEITIHSLGNLRPIHFTSENVHYVITPIRYKN